MPCFYWTKTHTVIIATGSTRNYGKFGVAGCGQIGGARGGIDTENIRPSTDPRRLAFEVPALFGTRSHEMFSYVPYEPALTLGFIREKLVPRGRIELPTSSLPRMGPNQSSALFSCHIRQLVEGPSTDFRPLGILSTNPTRSLRREGFGRRHGHNVRPGAASPTRRRASGE